MAVDVEPGQGGEQGALADRSRVVGNTPDLDVAQSGRTDRQVVATRAAHEVLGPQARDQVVEPPRFARLSRGEELGHARRCGGIGHELRLRPMVRVARAAARPAAYRQARATCSCAPAISTQVAPNDRLCSYRPYVGSPGSGSR